MRRREFITAFGGAVASWPLSTHAQQPPLPVVGFLRTSSLADSAHLVTAFRRGLNESGFIEGQNVAIEFRGADTQRERLAALAAELIRRQVAVIVGDAVAMLAAKGATTTVPIVFAAGGDPVAEGLVANLNRPGGNVTGVNFFGGLVGAKRLELLRQLVPGATAIAMLAMPNTPNTDAERRDVEAAAQALGQQLLVLNANDDRDIDAAFSTFAERRVGALLVGSGTLFVAKRNRVVGLAARHALPASYHLREYVLAGGLMSYGASISDAYRQVGSYAGRILKGEKPGDLPVMRSTKFEFVINLNTAKALALKIPPTLLATADEVIE
jgi:putative ABC transport system substrate-binding protein